MTRARDTADTQDNSGGAVAPFVAGKNKIINGDFGIWQRGVSFTSDSVYGPDRWFLSGVTSQMTFTQITSSLPSTFQYGIKMLRNSGSTSATVFSVAQAFETQTSIPLQGQTVVLSFWAKTGANFAGTPIIRMYSGTGNNQSAASQFGGWTGYSEWQTSSVFSPTSTWTKFTSTGTVPADATQIGVRVGWVSSGTAGADDSLHLAGLQLEQGSVATPFTTASGSIGGELALCQRYYWRETAGTTFTYHAMGYATNTTNAVFLVKHPVRMRVVPTSVDYASLAIDLYGVTNYTFTTLALVSPVNAIDVTLVEVSGATGLTANRAYGLAGNNNASNYIGFSAEL